METATNGNDASAKAKPIDIGKVPPRRSSGGAGGRARGTITTLLAQNRKWAAARTREDPQYFQRLTNLQAPKYLWIGCADSRVPANVILGLEPGEVFVQRNVGNQATHTDLNCMSCLEYAVTELKVTTVIVCGHYGCGAVRAALRLPSKAQGLVNCWISDIRECRNQHAQDLKAISSTTEQVKRLCEFNVLRQAFHVATSPVVQAAWDQGQELHVFGLIYDLEDGLIRKLVGPISGNSSLQGAADVHEFEAMALSSAPEAGFDLDGHSSSQDYEEEGGKEEDEEDDFPTAVFKNKVLEHVSWVGRGSVDSTPKA